MKSSEEFNKIPYNGLALTFLILPLDDVKFLGFPNSSK